MAVEPLAFHPAGTLVAPASDVLAQGGVYLFAYDDGLPRITYVGTAGHFGQRLREHLGGFLTGQRTFWVAPTGEDLYEQMRPGERTAYERGVRDGRCWVPGTAREARPSLGSDRAAWHALDGTPWSADWFERALLYVRRLHGWLCPVAPGGSYDAGRAKALETRLQVALNRAFGLGYYDASRKQSWLGKVECRGDEAARCESAVEWTSFLGRHHWDDATRKVLEGLTHP